VELSPVHIGMGSDNKPGEDGAAPKPDSFFMPFLKIVAMCVVMQLIGLALAYAVFTFGASDQYSKAIAAAITAGQAPVFAALVTVAFGIRLVNLTPMIFKEKVMKGAMRDEIGINMRSNPFIYKSFGASKETVLFDNDGVIGSYNRANRSLSHMTENFGAVLAGLMLAGSCFPFPTFVCACAFSAGRIMHQVGYSGAYGKHGAGFGLSMLGSLTLEGLCLLVAMAGIGLLTVTVAETPSPTTDSLDARIVELEAIIKTLAAKV